MVERAQTGAVLDVQRSSFLLFALAFRQGGYQSGRVSKSVVHEAQTFDSLAYRSVFLITCPASCCSCL